MDREELARRLDDGQSYEAIARELSCSPSKVAYWAEKHGLTSRHAPARRPRGGIDAETLRRLVEQGRSVREMAAVLDVGASTVRYWLGRHELTTVAAEARRRRRAANASAPDHERWCPRHGNAPHVARASGHRCRRCAAEQVAERRRRVKRLLVEEAGGCCALCGYDRYVGALQFHHLDPSSKRFGVSGQGAALSMPRARAEAAKCILLCANCHAEVEGGAADLPVRSRAADLSMLDGEARSRG